ncbi:hypothetical protein [Pseudomonas wadenswilerensis]|uniref:Uncharacterized protein n=1 Tax=Pseudomonas wadenswilerensis TaxID=1785161 RepID=A0A380T248_9PSED|nr:hypothetical protein [Pseudomonas wadenswilerensis]SUQ64103.1 hypothetical protein CCOS864_03557 [Pseudomonas wadenswilerensis]
MGDHEYLCSLYGLEAGEDEDLIDIVLAGDTKELRAQEDISCLAPGRLVHRIWLTKNVPACVVKVELNSRLSEELNLNGFNTLSSNSPQDPGSWFVEKGFTVRSKKINGFWQQYAFASSGPQNLTRSEIISYLRDVALLEFDESQVNDYSLPTKVG